MLIESGKVLAVDEDGIWVETHKQSVCGQCAAKKGCGQSLLANTLAKDMTCIKAYFISPQRRIWSAGDQVSIGIDENAMLFATCISYFVPLCLMVIGALLAHMWRASDFVAIVGAVVGLYVGAKIVRWHASKNDTNSFYRPVVIEP